jgi:hypothetical protein
VKRPVASDHKATDLRTTSVVCDGDGDGKSGYRVEVLYVRGSRGASRYNEYLASTTAAGARGRRRTSSPTRWAR